MVTILPAEKPIGGLVGVREDRSLGGVTGIAGIAYWRCHGGLRVGEDHPVGFAGIGFVCCWRGICPVGPHRHHVYAMTGRRNQPTRLTALSFPRPSGPKGRRQESGHDVAALQAAAAPKKVPLAGILCRDADGPTLYFRGARLKNDFGSSEPRSSR
jgi:hypothetical protein